MSDETVRAHLREIFDAAVKAAMPQICVPPNLPPPPRGRTIVVGAGKASAAMARAVEDHWPGADGADALSGVVVTRYGHAVECRRIDIREAAHPVPDMAGEAASREILATVSGLSRDDLVLCLVSGGGSALMALPAKGLTLEDKQAVSKALLKSGANIGEMNCVRKHLSAIKGGRLAAAAHPARVVSLLISDVPRDDPDVIASGPTVGDPTSLADARAVIDKYGIDVPESVRKRLADPRSETPFPDDPLFADNEVRLVATPQMSLEAAADAARKLGYTPLILGDSLEGEAREAGKLMAGIARQAALHGQPVEPPCVLLSGGETTVTVRGQGRGGRNVEFLLACAIALQGLPGVFGIACDTDGVDGFEEVAGGLITPDTLARAERGGIDFQAMLADNDAHSFFEAMGDQVVTGPTLTNVNDFRALAITCRPGG